MKRIVWSAIAVIVVVAIAAGLVAADDGQMFRRNISKTPEGETEKAAIKMMAFYVPAQASDGTLLEGIDYYDAEGGLVETRNMAKPLVAVYIDGIEEEHEEYEEDIRYVSDDASVVGGASFGHRDAFAALSLDDGATWKRANLSRSADLSSFILRNGHEYPGDAHYMTFAMAGDRVLAGWLSKYCTGGSPAYTLTDEEIAILQPEDPTQGFGLSDLYLQDLFGVAGTQRSVDYTLQGFPDVGEVPYSCVWTARGTLEWDDVEGTYDITWRKAERLTSGRRDANRLEMAAVAGAGFVMTWQEDPEGLRPGQGLGPGEGWSGAIVNQKTDVWYSYIGWDNFDLVQDELGAPIPLVDYAEDEVPQVGIPVAMPIRLSDNNMCKGDQRFDEAGELIDPYCYEDFDLNGSAELCATTVSWERTDRPPINICQAEDGRVLWGRTGGSRPRINLRGYDSDGDGENDSAWVVMAYEELKALGEGSADDDVDPIDIGKNIWYHTFDMFQPELVSQGMQLNHPARCTPADADPVTGIGCTEGEFYELLVDEWEGEDWDHEFYATEIARRFNIMTQSAAKAEASDSDLTAVLMYKQGIINQGGPADIFLRRFVLPTGFDPTQHNPYDYGNMVCDAIDGEEDSGWVYTDGSNPHYVEGLCLNTGINVTGSTIVSCEGGSTEEECAAAFPWEGGESPFPKVTEWRQCDGSDPASVDGCGDDNDLDDESWENPYDVAKGHRGFIDGDFIMQMYAWSPNWKANAVGNDKYNLYIRRSFDGGLTWTTTPASYECVGEDGSPIACDGTTTCENYLADVGTELDGTVCFDYGPGEFEQGRNLSQFAGTKVTVLDPRYNPTPGSICATVNEEDGSCLTYLYADDERNPSYFFIVYETGDNTTVAEGEATPLDLFYSRAYDWGDDYDEVEANVDQDGDGEIDWVWDWLEHDREVLSGEAAIISNPGGNFFYAVWNQWQEDEHENVSESDIWFRRVMYLDEETLSPESLAAVLNGEIGLPTASILIAPPTIIEYGPGSLIAYGTGKDNDHVGAHQGVTAHKWVSNIDGLLSNDKWLHVPIASLTEGLHTFAFSVQDDEGFWSDEASVTVGVGVPNTSLFSIFLPVTMR